MTTTNPWNNDAAITHNPTLDAIGGVFNDIFGAVNNGIHNATTGNGIASGNWDSLNTTPFQNTSDKPENSKACPK